MLNRILVLGFFLSSVAVSAISVGGDLLEPVHDLTQSAKKNQNVRFPKEKSRHFEIVSPLERANQERRVLTGQKRSRSQLNDVDLMGQDFLALKLDPVNTNSMYPSVKNVVQNKGGLFVGDSEADSVFDNFKRMRFSPGTSGSVGAPKKSGRFRGGNKARRKFSLTSIAENRTEGGALVPGHCENGQSDAYYGWFARRVKEQFRAALVQKDKVNPDNTAVQWLKLWVPWSLQILRTGTFGESEYRCFPALVKSLADMWGRHYDMQCAQTQQELQQREQFGNHIPFKLF